MQSAAFDSVCSATGGSVLCIKGSIQVGMCVSIKSA